MVGLGFVGLTLAAACAGAGIETRGVESDPARLARMAAGRPPFREPGLPALLRRTLRSGALELGADPAAVRGADVVFVAVGTPAGRGGAPDLSQLRAAVSSVRGALRGAPGRRTLVLKSTMPPGTTRGAVLPMLGRRAAGRLSVVVSPEFLQEGAALRGTRRPHLLVVGGRDGAGRASLEGLCRRVLSRMPPVVRTDETTAELIKYANNAFLATKISFINSVADVCQAVSADVGAVSRAIGADPRIGPLFLQPGPGFGGSCLPKDLSGMIGLSRSAGGAGPSLFEAVRRVNEERPGRVLAMARAMGACRRGETAALLGLAFKDGTDDVRDAVSVRIARSLAASGVRVRGHDPAAAGAFLAAAGPGAEAAGTVRGCLEGADCCIVLTAWEGYARLRAADFAAMRRRVVIDARRVLDPSRLRGVRLAVLGDG